MNKNINYVLVSVVVVVLAFILYPTQQAESKPIQKEIIKVEPQKEKEETVEVINEESPKVQKEVKKIEPKGETILKVEEEEDIEIKDENKYIKNIRISDLADIYDLQLREETVTLYSSSDKDNKYDISLKSSQKITSPLPGGRYILLNGTLEEDGKQSKFSLSFNEHYKDYTQYSYIEVTNKESNTIASCDGSFLSGITSEYRYNLQCDLYGDMLSCYVESEKEMPDVTKKVNISIDTMKLDKFQVNNLNKIKGNNNANNE